MATVLLALALMQALMGGGSALPPASSQHVIASGMATRYAPGLMKTVYGNRLAMGHVKPCRECAGFVALIDCDDLGRKVWLKHDGRVIGPLLAVDCAARADLPTIRERRIVAEFSYETWHQLGFPERPVPVTILVNDIRGDRGD